MLGRSDPQKLPYSASDIKKKCKIEKSELTIIQEEQDPLNPMNVWEESLNYVQKRLAAEVNIVTKVRVENVRIESIDKFLNTPTATLVELTFKNASLMDSILNINSKFRSLRKLDLSSNQLMAIPDLKLERLEVFNLSNNKILEAKVEVIREYPSLVSFNISNNQINFEDGTKILEFTNEIAQLDQLTEIFIAGNKCYEDYPSFDLLIMRELRHLKVNGRNASKMDAEIKRAGLPAIYEVISKRAQGKGEANEIAPEKSGFGMQKSSMIRISHITEEKQVIERSLASLNDKLQEAINKPSESLSKFSQIEFSINHLRLEITKNPELIESYFDKDSDDLENQMDDFLDLVGLLIQSQVELLRNIINMLAMFSVLSQKNIGKKCFGMLADITKSSKASRNIITEAMKDRVIPFLQKEEKPSHHIVHGLEVLMKEGELTKIWGARLENVSYLMFKRWLIQIKNSIEKNAPSWKMAEVQLSLLLFVVQNAKGAEKLTHEILELNDILAYIESSDAFGLFKANLTIMIALARRDTQAKKIYGREATFTRYFTLLEMSHLQIKESMRKSETKFNEEQVSKFCILVDIISTVIYYSERETNISKTEIKNKFDIFGDLISMPKLPKIPSIVVSSILSMCIKFCKGKHVTWGSHDGLILKIAEILDNMVPVLLLLKDPKSDSEDEKKKIISCVKLIRFYTIIKNEYYKLIKDSDNMRNLTDLADEIASKLDEKGRENILFALLSKYNDDVIMIQIAKLLQAVDVRHFSQKEIGILTRHIGDKKNVSAGNIEEFLCYLLVVLTRYINLDQGAANFFSDQGESTLNDVLEILTKTMARDLRDDPKEEQEKLNLAAMCVFFLRHLNRNPLRLKFSNENNLISCNECLKNEIQLKFDYRLDLEIERLPFTDTMVHLVLIIDYLNPSHLVTFRVFAFIVERLMESTNASKDPKEINRRKNEEGLKELDPIKPIEALESRLRLRTLERKKEELNSVDEKVKDLENKALNENNVKDFVNADGFNRLINLMGTLKSYNLEQGEKDIECGWLSLALTNGLLTNFYVELRNLSLNDKFLKEKLETTKKKESSVNFGALLLQKGCKFYLDQGTRPGILLRSNARNGEFDISEKKDEGNNSVDDEFIGIEEQMEENEGNGDSDEESEDMIIEPKKTELLEKRVLILSSFFRIILATYSTKQNNFLVVTSVVQNLIVNKKNFQSIIAACDETGWVAGNIGIKFLKILVGSIERNYIQHANLTFILDTAEIIFLCIERILQPVRADMNKNRDNKNVWNLLSYVALSSVKVMKIVQSVYSLEEVEMCLKSADKKFQLDHNERIVKSRLLLSKISKHLIKPSIIEILMDFLVESWKNESMLTEIVPELGAKELFEKHLINEDSGPRTSMDKSAVEDTSHLTAAAKKTVMGPMSSSIPETLYSVQLNTWIRVQAFLVTIVSQSNSMCEKVMRYFFILEKKDVLNRFQLKGPFLKDIVDLMALNNIRESLNDRAAQAANEKMLALEKSKVSKKQQAAETPNKFIFMAYGQVFQSTFKSEKYLQKERLILVAVDANTVLRFFAIPDVPPCPDCHIENFCPEQPILLDMKFGPKEVVVAEPGKIFTRTYIYLGNEMIGIDFRFTNNVNSLLEFYPSNATKKQPDALLKQNLDEPVESFLVIQSQKEPVVRKMFTYDDPFFSEKEKTVIEIKNERIFFYQDLDLEKKNKEPAGFIPKKNMGSILVSDINSFRMPQGSLSYVEMTAQNKIIGLLFTDELERMKFRKILLQKELFKNRPLTLQVKFA